ncbi:MAG: hypothetical protein MZV63_24000 [Marinilabiliales bacterium]|nr:hypothetical protein [Marinilabiliales bacterium]
MTDGRPTAFRGARAARPARRRGRSSTRRRRARTTRQYLRPPDAGRRGRLVAGDRRPPGHDGARAAGRAGRDRRAVARAACW